jgi:hypothetical protein
MARKVALAASTFAPWTLRGSLFSTLASPFRQLQCTRRANLEFRNEIAERQGRLLR